MSLWIVFPILATVCALPVYAPSSGFPTLIEASTDLGARWRTTFRRVILPIGFPASSRLDLRLLAHACDYIAPNWWRHDSSAT